MFNSILLFAVTLSALANTLATDSNLDLDDTLLGFNPLIDDTSLGFNPLIDDESGLYALPEDDGALDLNIQEGGSDGPLTLDPTMFESDLDLPLDEEWETISGVTNEDGLNLEIPLADDVNGSNVAEEIFNIDNLATDLCSSDPPSSRRIRKRTDSCTSFYPDTPLQLPNVGNISQELIRQKHCSRSQWSQFGNIPVCVKEMYNVNDMSRVVLRGVRWGRGPLEVPPLGWALVYGALYIYADTCVSGLVYCCGVFLPHLIQSPMTPFSPPKGLGYWCVPGLLRDGQGP